MLDVTKVSRYDVLERIAENAFSVVYRGRDSVHQRPVAIKICVAADAALRHRFLRLAEAASPLKHPNIVEVLEFGSGDGRPYLIEEFLPGGDLRDWIDRGDPAAGERELEILDEVGRALEYAHKKGVLHQDLKPATVHLEDGHRVKLVDFGLARLSSAAAKLRQPGEPQKADGYLPPEQALGLPADARTDIYCFGALAYELVAKLPPFPRNTMHRRPGALTPTRPEPLTTFWPECPPAFAALVDRCLALSPGDRYAGFEELREELTPLVEGFKGRRRAQRTRGTRPEPTLAASSLDDTMAIPPDMVLPPNPAGTAEASAALQLEDTRETTLPLPPEVVEAAAKASAPLKPAHDKPAQDKPAPVFRPAEPVTVPAAAAASPPTLSPKVTPQPAASHAPLASPASSAPRATPAQRPAFRRSGSRLLLGLLVLGGLIALGLAVLFWPSSPPRPQPTPAVSPAPPPSPTAAPAVLGAVWVDATPWGEITRLTSLDGRELPLPANRTTPLTLALAPGGYRLELRRPGLTVVRSCSVTVSAAGAASCVVDLERIEAADYFREAGWWR